MFRSAPKRLIYYTSRKQSSEKLILFCYTQINALLRNTQNGRPKSLLVSFLIFSLSSPQCAAQTESGVQAPLGTQNTLTNSSEPDIFDNKLFVGVVVAPIVQGLFPVFRYFYTKRKQRDTYIAKTKPMWNLH